MKKSSKLAVLLATLCLSGCGNTTVSESHPTETEQGITMTTEQIAVTTAEISVPETEESYMDKCYK